MTIPDDGKEGLKMHRRRFAANVIAGVAIALAFTVAAPAQNSRSYVATTGSDVNNCSASAYCRTLAAALAVTNPGGEIIVVDSDEYGPATISRPVVITAVGIDASITQTTAGLVALTIATTGNVTINGLNLYGGGIGSVGIWVQQAGFLRLYGTQIDNFAGSGIEMTSGGRLAMYDSKITGSGEDGLVLNNGANADVQNSSLDNSGTAGAQVTGGGMLTFEDSSAQYNQVGFWALNGTVTLHNDRVTFNTTGMLVSANGQLYVADCLVSDNANSYIVAPGGTLTASRPGTNLITPGQSKSGTLSSATVLQ
jgi:hypothetical protein